jgi:hypothetical protein
MACAWFCNSARVGICGRVGGQGAKSELENGEKRVATLIAVRAMARGEL